MRIQIQRIRITVPDPEPKFCSLDPDPNMNLNVKTKNKIAKLNKISKKLPEKFINLFFNGPFKFFNLKEKNFGGIFNFKCFTNYSTVYCK